MVCAPKCVLHWIAESARMNGRRCTRECGSVRYGPEWRGCVRIGPGVCIVGLLEVVRICQDESGSVGQVRPMLTESAGASGSTPAFSIAPQAPRALSHAPVRPSAPTTSVYLWGLRLELG